MIKLNRRKKDDSVKKKIDKSKIKEIQKYLEKKYSRPWLSYKELSRETLWDYADTLKIRPKYIFDYSHRYMSGLLFPIYDAARIIYKYKDNKK